VRAWRAGAAGHAGHTGIDPAAPHDHGDGFTHRHALPGEVRGWRGLIALGASGGLLPCPSAMVVMLSAISLQRVGFGLALIFAFSIGLAAVLVGIGVALIHGRALIERLGAREGRRPGLLLRVAPLASALVVTTAGVWITGRALLSTGVLRL
jgi:ABC-type nickel/cobalt efflux system permease component RcnA